MRQSVIVFIDAPDPDNFVLVKAAAALFPGCEMKIALTGRPVRFNSTREHANWHWDLQSSRMAQEASAMRLRNFMRNLGVRVTEVYDGGIAPRTLVPHWIHFAEYYKFLDVDPLAALRYSELEPQEELVEYMLSHECLVLVGGPMTGLRQVIERNPEVAEHISEVHAMYATWGNVSLMDFGAGPRGAMQFNVACDPASAYGILKGLRCPIYLMPTEVTRHVPVGFSNVQALRNALPKNGGVDKLMLLYAVWYDAAVKPRQEKNPEEMIYIHDLVSAFSAVPDLRNGMYSVLPTVIDAVPHLAHERDEWGVVKMHVALPGETTNVFVATGFKEGGERLYLETLYDIMNV